MSKKTLIISLIFLIIILIGFIIGNSIGKKVFEPDQASIITYYCEEGTIKADYATSSVALLLSDGRDMTLPQTISASGIRYEASSTVFWSKGDNAFMTEGKTTTYTNCVAGVEKQVDENTLNYTDASKTFSFLFPHQDILSGGDMGYTQDWRVQSTSSGLLLAVVHIPRTFFQEKTNFSEAKFTVGTSADPNEIKNCLISDRSNEGDVMKVMIGDRQFTRITYGDAGAGNYYETQSYRTVYKDQCYAIEYTIHSTNIYNYSPDQGVKEFDKAQITAVLENMVKSFKFIQ